MYRIHAFINIDMNKNIQQQQPQLETVEEQFDDFEQMLKDMSLQDIETMQMKLGVELVKDQVKEYLGVADDQVRFHKFQALP